MKTLKMNLAIVSLLLVAGLSRRGTETEHSEPGAN